MIESATLAHQDDTDQLSDPDRALISNILIHTQPGEEVGREGARGH